MVPARLVIVVASWACSVVSHVEASSAKDGSLAELRQKFLAKLKEDSTGPGSHSLQSLQEMASALLQSDSDLSNLASQTPVMYQLVNLTRELDEGLSAQLLIQHQAAEDALNNFSGWADCARTRDECLAGSTTTSNAQTTTTTGEASSTSTSTTTTTTTTFCSTDDPCCEMSTCSDEEDDLRLHMNYTCSELARENRSVDDVKNERCNETWATTYEDYLERDIEKLATLQLLNENCTYWTQRWLNQTGTCADRALSCRQQLESTLDANQTVLQDDNVTIGFDGYECCFGTNTSSYDSCMRSAAITWQDEVNSQQILAESRATEQRAVKRIMCLCDVLLMNASQDQRGALEACIAATYDASQLSLDVQPKPSSLECDNSTYVPAGW